MRYLLLLIFALMGGLCGYSQLKDYSIGPRGDTLNAVDQKDQKQGKWVNHYDEVRGEPGFEEEGIYKNNRKEGVWRLYNLQGDLIGLEQYKWGNKCGICQYFGINGGLIREESWIALNPDKLLDTLAIEDINNPDHYKTVIIKNTGAAFKDGVWKFYDPLTGMVSKTETWEMGKLEKSQAGQRSAPDSTQAVAKPKEVLDFEKKASKHKIKYQDGSVH